LKLLKEAGCNAIRCSHNPPAPEFLDLCDRMGFLVMDEAFDEWTGGKKKWIVGHNAGQPGTDGYHSDFEKWADIDIRDMVLRDRNHPSIIMWSIGNEIDYSNDPWPPNSPALPPIAERLIKDVKAVDTTRPVTAACAFPETNLYKQLLDVEGYNYMERLYAGDHAAHPNRVIYGSENFHTPAAWQAVASNDYIAGQFLWTGIDYLGEARWPSKNSSSGVIDLCGFPKDGYYFYQSQWTTKPMIHLSPHWNWKGNEGKVIPVMAYTNCDSVELFVNGRSFGIKALEFPRQGNSGAWNRYDRPQINTTTSDLHLIWDVPYEPGTIKAVGRKNNQVVCEEIIQTTGIPASVKLSVDRESINADTRDAAHVKVEILDENGLTIPDANNLVTLMIKGNGKLIGFDNGNPQDHTSMKSNQRKTFNGLALAVIQANDKPGEITVTATSGTLNDAVIRIKTIETIFPFAKY